MSCNAIDSYSGVMPLHVVLDVILCPHLKKIIQLKSLSYRAPYAVTTTVAILMHLLHVCILPHNSIQGVKFMCWWLDNWHVTSSSDFTILSAMLLKFVQPIPLSQLLRIRKNAKSQALALSTSNCSLLMQQTSLCIFLDSTLPSVVIPVGISSSIIAGKHVLFSFIGVRFCNPISNAGPCCQADLCHMKAVVIFHQGYYIKVNVVTYIKWMNLLETRLGGTTAPLDMFIDFKVLWAKALLTCKTLT